MAVPTSPFPTILNFRDIGQSINGLQTAVFEDRSSLVLVYQIKTIIDLRSKTEHIQQRKKYDAQVCHLGAGLGSAGLAAPTKIPGIRYREINLNGSSYERTLLKRLRYTSLAKLIALMAVGRRTEAIFILGSEVIQPRGLLGQAKDSIDSSVMELKQILEILAEAENYPVLFHCTSGKDRTGLIAFTLLLILDIPLDVISADYLASEGELVAEKEARIQELSTIGLSADFAGCSPDWVVNVHKHVTETYGSLHKYLDWIGFGEALRSKIKLNLLEDTKAKS
ncbi:MAG: hypothetical protein Q9185_001385 [Variospora sp. 1 TL-2023]